MKQLSKRRKDLQLEKNDQRKVLLMALHRVSMKQNIILERDHNIQSMRNEKHELSKHQVLESMNSRMTVERVSQLEKE